MNMQVLLRYVIVKVTYSVGSEPVSLPGACGSTEHKRDCEISVNKSLDG